MTAEAGRAAALTNSAFLAELARAADNGTSLWVTAFGGSPDVTDAQNWRGGPYSAATMSERVDEWADHNTYYCVAALRPSADGELRRRKANFARLLALVLDDVSLEDVFGQVSYALTTSPGKHQIGIFIDSGDRDASNPALVDRLVTRLVETGRLRADAAGNNAVRYVRLPLGSNLKPRDSGAYRHDLTLWRPDVRLSLADAAAAFGVDLDALRQDDSTSPTPGQQPAATRSDTQGELLRTLTSSVLRGDILHDGLNRIAASLVATGMPGGAVVNHLRALMDCSLAARDERWAARYADIPRAVTTAHDKFARSIVAGAADEAASVKPAGLPLIFAEAIDESAISLPQIVEDVLTAGSFGVMYGESNAGKSFLSIDMSCCIGSGLPWLGRRVVQGVVLYVAGEGAASVQMRLLAWQRHHGVIPNVAIVPIAVNLLDPAADLRKIVDAARRASDHYGMPVTLINIDTLARAFGAGNENAAEDMGAVIANIDALRAAVKCAVLVIHHAGKDVAKGSRGHSSLRAATDTEIEVTGDHETHLHVARITKQRDLASRGDELVARFSSVPMGYDQWGKQVTTCIVEPATAVAKPAQAKGDELTQALLVLVATAPERTMRRAAIVKELTAQGYSSGPVYRAIRRLVEDAIASENGPYFHLLGRRPNM